MTFNEKQFRFLHGGWYKSEILRGYVVLRQCSKFFFLFFVSFGGLKRGVGGRGLGCFGGGGGLKSTFF